MFDSHLLEKDKNKNEKMLLKNYNKSKIRTMRTNKIIKLNI